MTMTARQLNNEDDNSIVDAESASMSKSCLMLKAPPCFVKYSSDQPYWETIDDDVKVQLVCDDSRGTNPRGDTYTNRHLTSEPMSPMFSVRKWSWPSRSPCCGPCHLEPWHTIDPGWNSLRNPRCAETSIPRRWGLPGCHWYNDQWKVSGRYKTRWERHTTLSCLSIIQLLMITPFECIL